MKKILILTGIGVVLFGLGYWMGSRQSRDVQNRATDDTTKVVAPTAKKVRTVGAMTVPVTMRLKEPDEPTLPQNGIVVFPPDSLDSCDSLYSKDSLVAMVPIEQKEYKDSNYTVWVSGFMPKLDSMYVVNKTYTKTVTRFHRWNVGITGGYGYGFLSHKLEPFLGVGVTINLFR